MYKRVAVLYAVITLMAFCVMVHTLNIVLTPQYVEAAGSQSVYNVSVCRTRGRIYDCKMRSLAGGRLQYRAVIAPSRDTTAMLTGVLPPEKMVEIKDRLTGTYPFVCDVDDAAADGKGAIVFPAEKRYGANSIAVHTVGYLGSDGQGTAGIERAYDEYLSAAVGELSVRFTVDATGKGLGGIQPEITDTRDNSLAGVVLTLDADIQRIAEDAASLYMEKGAVVVMDAHTGQIRASVSVPDFDQTDIAQAMERDDSPLLNRAVSAYDIGSVFKLVVAAAALENGVSAEEVFCCTGSTEIGRNVFHCANRNGHGQISMEEAFAKSCNTYFIELARKLGGKVLLDYARCFGFGHSVMLAEGWQSAAGCIPDEETLHQPAALANFSFGQGKLMATPVHIASMTATVAGGGKYVCPTVIDRLVDSSQQTIARNMLREGRRVISEATADTLKRFMCAAVEYGTATAGGSEYVSCAAKTGTAQTGIYADGHRVTQAWFTGFFPAEQPEYTVTVLVEDGQSGGVSAGPVFRYIADQLAPK